MLNEDQIRSMGLVIVAFSAGSFPIVEAAANPDNYEMWLEWAKKTQIPRHRLDGYLWELEHPVSRI